MNFDVDFIKWVKVLYKNTNSCAMNNGHKTAPFKLERGVHQGCPLSALLFIILVQVLQRMLNQRQDIAGVSIKGKQVKILQMADDTTILTSNIEDIPKILDLLEDFREISGLKTNVEKTIAYRIGKLEGQAEPENQHGLTWKTLPISLLGITISTNKEEIIKENFSDKLQSIELLTRIWCRRNLSLKGKLTIINSILIPKLIYPGTILEVPDEIIKEASNIIKNFFWNWKKPKIRLDVLIRKIEKGGIKYPCIECKLKSWKMLWATRALRLEEAKPLWISIVNSLLPHGLTLPYLLKTRTTSKMLDNYCPNLPAFYKNVILNWRKVSNEIKTNNKEKVMNECIWLNDKITVNKKPLYCTNSLCNGLLKIKDLLTSDGKFLSHEDLNRKFGTSLTFLDLLRIRMTLPHEWKNILLDPDPETTTEDLLYNKLQRLRTLKTKDLYILTLENEHDCTSHTNSQIYWQTKYKIDDETMKQVYTLPYRVSRLTTLQSLQYKILNKILNCNHWLHRIKIKELPKCRFCPEDETIEHFFFGCEITKDFWYGFLTWWNALGNDEPKILEEKDILMGYNIPNKKEMLINQCILIGKKMIYDQKNYRNKQPDLYKFHCDLKDIVEIDRQICIKNCRLSDFENYWGEITNL